MLQAWFSQPALRGDCIVFSCEDDLFSAPLSGGPAQRLTAGPGVSSAPVISPDGAHIVFTSSAEGVAELAVIPVTGGIPRRLTYLGGHCRALGFSPDGQYVYFRSNARQPSAKDLSAWQVPLAGGQATLLPYGLAVGLAVSPSGAVALCRHVEDLARWRQYRGGRVGELWVRPAADQPFARLGQPGGGNVCAPMWWQGRLAFVSDHDGHGNLFTVAPDGTDLQQHTTHEGSPIRYPAVDGERIVYTHEGAVWLVPTLGLPANRLEISAPITGVQTARRWVSAAGSLKDAEVDPTGALLAVTLRGQLLVSGPWEGPMLQLGAQTAGAPPRQVRHRLPRWLPDSQQLLVVHDEPGEEQVVLLSLLGQAPRVITPAPFGRAMSLSVAPTGAHAALSTHDGRLHLLDLTAASITELAHGRHGPIDRASWSPDGRWLTWSEQADYDGRSCIMLHSLESGITTQLTDAHYADSAPDFDPSGRYLFFLSMREMEPVRDSLRLEYGFPRGGRPYGFTLREDVPDPFAQGPRPLKRPPGAKRLDPAQPVQIDLEGIQRRVFRFNVPDARWERVFGLPSGKVLLIESPLRSERMRTSHSAGSGPSDRTVRLLDLHDGSTVIVHSSTSSLRLDLLRGHALLRAQGNLHLLPADPDKAARDELAKRGRPARTTGVVDLRRFRTPVDVRAEWRQMVLEAWRMTRDHYWRPAALPVPLEGILARAQAQVERVHSRAELSDLIWCMGGELQTSHAYESGGDYGASTLQRIGRLGVTLAVNPQGEVRLTEIMQGELGDPDRCSPLFGPGRRVQDGDELLAIDGRAMPIGEAPESLLVGRAGRDLQLLLRRSGVTFTLDARALIDDERLRYREQVLRRRRQVHDASGGRLGYVHIPDMGPRGYADFYRDYRVESQHDGLVVDVRGNRGGHVSQLLLSTLVRPRLGFSVARHLEPARWPRHASPDVRVAVTDERSGSDGDIFSHAWKLLKLGPLVGTRTWGGTIGIWPRHDLIDGAMITTPEYATWFPDVGFGTENFGTEPDVEVRVSPEQQASGEDPQLARAIALALDGLNAHSELRPDPTLV